jgi:hypothetical protein
LKQYTSIIEANLIGSIYNGSAKYAGGVLADGLSLKILVLNTIHPFDIRTMEVLLQAFDI